ncbi:TPA: restriction endonuclease subunit S [Haemophilus influenzae]|uniref:restriction endonuclease subunit S n=1 Tax=Haemophilus influenzae TaxID=727 RepID=UPI000DD2C525|nr:restriction endonuclease subunit S [Haemophilus influenzae]
MSNLKEYRLGDCIGFIIDNRGKNPPLSDSGYELIETNMISSNNKYPDFDKVTKYVSEDTYNNWFRKGHPKIGDILISTVGNIGKVAIVNEDKGCIAQNLIGLRVNEKIIAEYLYYFLIKKDTQEQILSLNIGSVQPSIKVPHLLNLEIKIPELLKQKECIQVLSKLDDKIQLNTQINQTLEQIAQALFKSWFVDFDPVRAKVQALSDGMSLEQAELAAMQAISGKTPEELTALSQTQPDRYAELAETAKAFPCEMVEIDGVEVPKGWELSTIGDCYDVVMGQSPKGETYNENKQGMLFYQGRAEFGWRFPTPRLFTTDPKRIAEQNSILMSIRAPVGDINIALEKCCIGRGLAALQHKSKSLSFGLYQIQSIKPELDLFNGEGTVFGSINQANLKNIQIINPEEKFIQLFEKNLSSCDSKIMNNEIENNALKEIRDLLLPRLLSGEIQL